MTSSPEWEALQQALGVHLDQELLCLALTHRSYSYENGGIPTNERLEFLGDAILGFVVTQTLYRAHPHLPEGQLAKLRSSVVNMRALADVGRRIGLGDHLLLGRGERSSGGRDKSSILADTVEALIGAVYLDHGIDAVGAMVLRLVSPLLKQAEQAGAALDWKTSLQELGSLAGLGAPEYQVAEEGPDHAKKFSATATLAGEVFGHGHGRSKKEAERIAAGEAWAALRARFPDLTEKVS
ncbi:MAG: ribonuclease III [Actinomycetota bacterium]